MDFLLEPLTYNHIYIYICMYVCMYVCMYIYVYMYMSYSKINWTQHLLAQAEVRSEPGGETELRVLLRFRGSGLGFGVQGLGRLGS